MKTLLASLALLIACCTSPLLAQPGDGDPRPRRDMSPQLLKEKLNLTDAQLKSLGDIRRDAQKTMIDTRSTIAKKRVDMRALMATDAPARADVERLTREIADLQVAQRMQMFDTDQKVLQVLSPEQQTKWKELRGERMDRFREGMRDRMGRGMQRRGRS